MHYCFFHFHFTQDKEIHKNQQQAANIFTVVKMFFLGLQFPFARVILLLMSK